MLVKKIWEGLQEEFWKEEVVKEEMTRQDYEGGRGESHEKILVLLRLLCKLKEFLCKFKFKILEFL